MLKRLSVFCLGDWALLLLPVVVSFSFFQGTVDVESNVSNAASTTHEWVYTCTEDGVSKELILLDAPKKVDILVFKGEKFAYSKHWVDEHCTYEWKLVTSK